MIPRNIQPSGQYDFFKKRTDEVAHKSHSLVILSDKLNWGAFNKSLAFPTDSQLCFKALSCLVRFCDDSGIKLRQTYKRLSKKSLIFQLRFVHFRRFKKARREQKRLRRVYLGRVMRDIKRKVPNWQKDVRLSRLLEITHQNLSKKEMIVDGYRQHKLFRKNIIFPKNRF